MEQYLNLLKAIRKNGTYKPAARAGMPGTQSLFGYQLRHDLSKGFPLLTTKKVFWKAIVVELLWFLRGDTNIKYLIDNGVNIWNEDSYNFYLKICKQKNIYPCSFEGFKASIETDDLSDWKDMPSNYKIGDCGFQYGKVWRDWKVDDRNQDGIPNCYKNIDQIKNLINSLKSNPESRRHLVTAIDPAHDTELALYWCHSLVQFNCRPLAFKQRLDFLLHGTSGCGNMPDNYSVEEKVERLDSLNIPKYYLDCQLYQRSCDVFLGVPYNIASYALLTHILAKICNMIPGEYIHTFGDVHIYDNHKDAIAEQLVRNPTKLPELIINDEGNDWAHISYTSDFSILDYTDFELKNYNPQSKIKGELSTGLIK